MEKARNKPTCDTCIHKVVCDIFFAREYARLRIKEPENWKNMACKLYEQRPDISKT